ncbi:MAG: hypothetical protein QOF01_4238 [Thermomicrobiales bacterium]|jgi:ureidoglycolate hydrolase|nr:hypothetical protein [Thermomicrobiales bacterium]MEA2528967.1 hypothetical protein [Thermomicrobiales bacterium]MEA2597769.1 hypothetical protein [Thermomicrobiales bacterium]
MMAELPSRLVEVGAFFGDGYRPVLDFHGWRVAMLRSTEVANPDAFHRVERHRETNEVFILTTGQADLIVCDGDAEPGEAFVTSMDLNVAYNIGQAVWHNVVMSPDAHIILFERTDTTVDNSDYAELPPEQIATITARSQVGQGKG